MLKTVYLGLGSNSGDRRENLTEAVKKLKDHPVIYVYSISSVYETLPIGNIEQRSFFNAALKIETSLEPEELLKVLKRFEFEMGRVSCGQKWQPRVIDIDILLYENKTLNYSGLTVPHPGIKERAFVVVPLLEINPHLCLPEGVPVKELLLNVGDQLEGVEKLDFKLE